MVRCRRLRTPELRKSQITDEAIKKNNFLLMTMCREGNNLKTPRATLYYAVIHLYLLSVLGTIEGQIFKVE